MPDWLKGGVWGLAAGSALLMGAALAYFVELSHRLIAAIMAFGAGVLVAVLSVSLMADGFREGGVAFAACGVLAGATVFSATNWLLGKRGATNRKRCGGCVRQASETDVKGSGMGIAIGALVDGIPESIIIGLNAAQGDKGGLAVLLGFFLANFPQGLSGSSGMKEAGRSSRYIFGVWGGIAVASGLAALLGQSLAVHVAPAVVGAVSAFAAGGVLAMLAETMFPEAFENEHHFVGVATVTGFVTAFILIRIDGK